MCKMLNHAKTKSHEYPNFERSQEIIATKVKLMDFDLKGNFE